MQPGDRDVAVIVVQAGQQAHQNRQRVGHHAAPHPRVQAVVERGDLDHAVRESAKRHGQRRDVGAPVVRVGDDDDVGGQQVAVRGQQPRQRRRARLLLPLDEDRHADRRVAVVGPERSQMRCDAGFVVSGAPSVESSVALGRLERRRLPVRAVPFGLHVVVCVQATPSALLAGAGWRAMTAGAPPSATIRTSPNPASDNSSDTASALRCTSGRRAGSAHTDSMRTRFSRSARTDGSTSRTLATRSLMGATLVALDRRERAPLHSIYGASLYKHARSPEGD